MSRNHLPKEESCRSVGSFPVRRWSSHSSRCSSRSAERATPRSRAVPKNSVGTTQLKNNAVTAAKIKDDAITAAKISGFALEGSKVVGTAGAPAYQGVWQLRPSTGEECDARVLQGSVGDRPPPGERQDQQRLGHRHHLQPFLSATGRRATSSSPRTAAPATAAYIEITSTGDVKVVSVAAGLRRS